MAKKIMIDLTGKVFERLTVIGFDKKNKLNKLYWKCKCKCGKIKSICGEKLRYGIIKSCGCLRKELRNIDLTGKRFGSLIVVKFSGKKYKKIGIKYWKCKCDCGKTTNVLHSNLKLTKSCGCLNGVDLTGKKVNELTVIKKTKKRFRDGSVLWRCKCNCGKLIFLSTYLLNKEKIKSCGCFDIRENLSGKKFGKLTALKISYSYSKKRKNGNKYWKCKCDCGKTTYVPRYFLKNKITKSCGCLRKKYIDITRKRFGLLIVIKLDHIDENRRFYWKCKCDCGNTKLILGYSLNSGKTKSCGCRGYIKIKLKQSI